MKNLFVRIRRKIGLILKRLFLVNRLDYFILPVKDINGKWYITGRSFEIPFIHRHIDPIGKNKRILEFGCSRSYLALQLATLGYEVVGVDLRHYPFSHPNLRFFQMNILDYDDDKCFDYISSVSTLEHVGLGFYKEERKKSDLYRVTNKLTKLLKIGGKIIITVPFGIEYEDHFQRSFTYEGILSLFDENKLKLTEKQFFQRYQNFRYWKPCSFEKAQSISNARQNKPGYYGVNCIGCFVWQKIKD